MAQNEPTIASILRELAAQYDRIVAEREVFDRVLEQRPSAAKDPYASIREKLRFGAPRLGWVRLGGGELVPLRVALDGLRFRIIPSAEELAGGMLARTKFEPFVGRTVGDVRLEDAAGRALPGHPALLPLGEGLFGPISAAALALGDWFARQGFAQGDSILVTVRQAAPPVLRLEREPAADFRADAVAQQERDLLDALAELVARSRTDMLFAEDSVLPIYARAAWRTAYPGRPWQQLVASDRRLQLVDDAYIVDSSYRRPLDALLAGEQELRRWEEHDQDLLAEIHALQAELLASRREAARLGLWDGLAPRASTSRVIYDMRQGTTQVIHPGAVDALQDHSAEIDERAIRGDYAAEGWDEDADADELDELDELDIAVDLEPDGGLLGVEDIDDIQTFMEQNPALVESTQRLMASLSPDEVARLQAASSPDEVQRILTGQLNKMLFSDPALFVTLAEGTPPSSNGDGPHQDGVAANGNGGWEELEEWEDGDDDDAWDDEGDEDEEDEEVDEARERAVTRSNDLMEQFYQHQIAQGKSDSTATSRTGDLWAYGDFLANYYGRSLDEGDYATLDECLFFFYPRKVLNGSPRAAREMCTSIKQFYAFLRASGAVRDDAFAQAMWRRRDQAARAVELYDRIDGESPQFERLFAHLFAPYTA